MLQNNTKHDEKIVCYFYFNTLKKVEKRGKKV